MGGHTTQTRSTYISNQKPHISTLHFALCLDPPYLKNKYYKNLSPQKRRKETKMETPANRCSSKRCLAEKLLKKWAIRIQ